MPQALAGVSSSTPPAYSRAGGLIRVVSPAELDDQDRAHLAALSEAVRPQKPADLSTWIRNRWYVLRNHRNTGQDPLNERLLRAQRMFEGKYDPVKLAYIKQFGGSEVYSRLVAVKCRGATSLLRDVYLGADRPWDIDAQPDPPIPPDVQASIIQLISSEVQTMMQAGQPPSEADMHMRLQNMMHAAQQAARRNAMGQADNAANKIDDILHAGRFYDALAEFLTDLPIFPFAVLKGPIVRMVPKLSWSNGQPEMTNQPQMFWERIDPFNIYWTPGARRFEDSEVMERKKLTRSDLNDLLGLPGYDEDAVRGALTDYANGLRDWLDSSDTETALASSREDPNLNRSNMIDALEYHGSIQGHMLLDQGVSPSLISDPDRDYQVQTWVVGTHVLKTQLNPSPRQRHPYYLTSFEKVPGTVSGHGLSDILEDMQEIANATLRSLVNNMGIASGPQVIINDEALAPTANGDELYPWKRWHVVNDPLSNNREPITFFQPQSNAQELLMVYQAISGLADDVSAIPRYITGEGLSGGAGRTASGLSMLMNNSSKILQTVASNVDIDCVEPLLTALYDMIMLTDTSGLLTGDEQIVVSGVKVALQKETERQKQLQFLQITANPIDAPIIGVPGRARVLRAVAGNMGLPDDVVPDDVTIADRMKAQEQAAAAAAAMHVASGGQLGPDGQPMPQEPENGSRGGSGGGQKQTPPAANQAQGMQAPAPTPARLSDYAPAQNNFRPMPQAGRALPVGG